MRNQPYTFRDLLHLARTYQSLGFNREYISELLHIARLYWQECWEEERRQLCQDAGE